MKALNEYNAARIEILKYFRIEGFHDGIDDCRSDIWFLDDSNVCWGDSEEQIDLDDGDAMYCASIETEFTESGNRRKKCLYEEDEYTAIIVRSNGERYLKVLSNANRRYID